MENIENAILGKLFSEKNDICDTDNCPVAEGVLPKKLSLAMAYVPFQQWETPYENEIALGRGTIFPSLDKPFIGEEAVSRAHNE